ncbi:MAG TPA: ATP-binding cassette domain-containing protein [Firmicutes bacterium]|nr:ATP-binding cassette domain-containing protein [Bacillota bacterium]
MIKFEDVWAGYGDHLVLRGATFQCPAQRVTAIVGPSGSGKSTVLRLLMGFICPSKGRILVDGEDVTGCSERQWQGIRRKMGMVFQNSALFDSLTICQNVGFYPHYVERRPWREVRREALELLEDLGLAGTEDKLPSELSGGMKRRVALARSLIYKPQILLYDEPTTGLDPHMTEVVSSLIEEMADRFGITSIVVSHDLPSIYGIADHVVLIDEGQSVVVGQPRQLLTSEDERVIRFTASWREQIHSFSDRGNHD